MPPLDQHQQALQRGWLQEQRLLERRRQCLVAAAAEAARTLRERWPMLRTVWLFGSVLDPDAFCRHSDLDLALEGLPDEDHLAALRVVEAVVDPALAAANERGVAIDVVRCEDLPPHWRQRLRQRALALS